MAGFLSRWRRHLVVFLAVLGPGFITAMVDNDSGGILTYSQAGARWGYLPLWTLAPITLALIVSQEMCSRMGAVSGKGLSDLIREEFGLRITFIIMALLVLANMTNIMAEFAGVAVSLDIFGVSKYISVPIAALAVWFLAVMGSYEKVEKVFLFACSIFAVYIAAGILVKPDWGQAMINSVKPKLIFDGGYITMLIAMVGTTIAPWMQFYQQAAVVEKGITAKEYRESRIEVVVGCILTSVIAFFIIVACAGAYRDNPTDLESAKQAAQALKPFGPYAYLLFSAGLLNASVFAACILPLSTAYSVCEGLGFESGISKKWKEAPIFYWLYTILIAGSALLVITPGFNMVKNILLSQVLNGMLLPFILIFMILLVNRTGIMKEWVNSPFYNAVAWATVVIVIGMTVALMGITIRNPQ
ncbi:MAG TPA: divalent metal cation transporter [Bryobacteraceae bacterium]|jgi:NRAMP (natural resistance-associated macrophage protein)-like metal ion transporter